MNDDGPLLRRFAETHDQECFRQVLERHIGFVYAVALRRVGDPHTAQEATQAVFVALAHKAATVARNPSVIGWLHRSAYYETRNLMRAHTHRLAREAEAARLGTASADGGNEPEWATINGVLDEVLQELSEPDRVAILARYFAGQSYAEIGTSLRLTENAARMRVDRALGRLREHLQRRGVTSTAAALAAALPAYATVVVPASMTATIAKTALAGIAGAAAPAGLFTLMSTTKVVTTAAVFVVAGGLIYEYRQTAQLKTTLAAVQEERAAAKKEVRALEQQVKELRAGATAAPQSKPAPATNIPVVATKTDDGPPPPPGITRKAPKGWFKNGSNTKEYDVGVDQVQTWGGMPSAYVASTTPKPEGFGGMMQTASAETYQNKRMRLTGWVKTEDANDGGGHLWFRVDGGGQQVVQFDNMDGRAAKGTTDWQECSLVLDVPAGATTLNYGFFVQGGGKMWVNGLTLEPVGADVPTTNMIKPPPKAPTNLGFGSDGTSG